MASSSQDAAEVGQEEVQIRLVTQQQQHTVTDTAIAVPVGVRRSHLSQMVNHLLARGAHSAPAIGHRAFGLGALQEVEKPTITSYS